MQLSRVYVVGIDVKRDRGVSRRPKASDRWVKVYKVVLFSSSTDNGGEMTE